MGAINQPSLEALSRSREALRVRQENALRARHPQRETDIFMTLVWNKSIKLYKLLIIEEFQR